MNKNHEKKQILIENLANHILNKGMFDTSLRSMAKAVGTSDRMLLHYFKDKNDLITEVLNKITENFMQVLSEIDFQKKPYIELLQDFYQTIRNPLIHSYTKTWLELAALSANGDQPYKTVSQKFMAEFLSWIKTKIMPDESIDTEDLSSFVLLITEGMIFLDSIDASHQIEKSLSVLLKIKSKKK